ncbi:MAG: ATP-binding cassette domain-containing protein [Flavobacteriaceae bacterium]|nr:ATP-binding cassette domain-containing protein [Flavobacteriaceae bacterium]
MSLQVENISKQFGSKKALDNVSFSLKKGSVTGFLGPNGAGKSTLMKILTGQLCADSGRAMVNGFDISKESLAVKKSIGYLAEQNALYDNLYVSEYLSFCARLHGVSKSNIEAVMVKTGLSEVGKQKIETLSKGYKQRVGLAAALIHDSKVLLLDEPTTGLDPNQLGDIRQLIKELGREKTVFFSSHILQEVEAVCEEVLILHQGKLVGKQKVETLSKSDENTLVVEFDYRIEDVLLKRLPHVKKVENPDGLAWEITFETTQDMRPAVFDFAHDNQLSIVQLRAKHVKLEALFKELTH